MRRFVGLGGLTVFVLIYVAIAMVVGANHILQLPGIVQLVYFAVAGFAWTIPAMWIIKWMRRGPQSDTAA
ncbi:DUF2842 domain-containing protein [Microbaculum marinum]|uniref:DUF2842 domain-containing protein n=1 Tax=Microbaculum marinum TaxID=1764581 RepID=A0AAW9RJ34_9HYPH